MEMKLLGETIPLENDFVDIYELKFLKDNPRVYACTHGIPGFDQMMEEEQQELIYEKLINEPSVKNLIPEVKRHGGLIEPILIRHDTKEVIEGNSRLAVYRKFIQESVDGEWELIPCEIVSNLTDDQQAAYLNQVHIKGKTKWSAYEKANFAYVRRDRGWKPKKIAELFGESEPTIRTNINVIKLMKQNEDNIRSHFNYYGVVVRNPEISSALKNDSRVRDFLLMKIKNQGSNENDSEFTAQDLRKKFPVVLRKPKVLKKYLDGTVDLDQGYQSAKISQVEERVKQAKDLLDEVLKSDVDQLEQGEFNAFKHAVKKLSKEVDRITKIVDQHG